MLKGRRKKELGTCMVKSTRSVESAYAVIVHNARDECVWKALGAGCWAEHLAYQLKPLPLKVESFFRFVFSVCLFRFFW